MRLAVRRRPQQETLTAYQLGEHMPPSMFGEFEGRAHDWIIARGESIIDVVSDSRFLQKYERADAPGLQIVDAHRTKLERALGIGSTETPEHLVTAVERLARLTIGDIPIDFTPGQWETLAHRAQKRQISVNALLRQIVDKITADIWLV